MNKLKIYTSSYNKIKYAKEGRFILVDITRGNKPKWFNPDVYRLQWLAPSWELLKGFKAGNITWDDYVKIYWEEVLSHYPKDQIIRVLTQLSEKCGDKDVVLLCHCGGYMRCHRSLVGQYIGAEEISENVIYNV